MTREIKFRGKTPQGEWLYGDLQQCNDGTVRIAVNNECWNDDGIQSSDYLTILEVNPNTIGQFTGLHDTNGKDIYEGDIIKMVWTDYVGKGKNKVPVLKFVENCPPKVISYRNGAFGYVNFEADEYLEEEWLPILNDDCEVIGNIYDNPELLKED